MKLTRSHIKTGLKFSGGIALGVGIKMAFNAAAQASGAGLVIGGLAFTYGVGKTLLDKEAYYKKEDTHWGQFKELTRQSFRNSAGLGASMAIGVNFEEIRGIGGMLAEKILPHVSPYIDQIKEMKNTVVTSFKNWLPKFRVNIPKSPQELQNPLMEKPAIVEINPPIIEETTELLQQVEDLEPEITVSPTPMEQLATLTGNDALRDKALAGNPQALKDVAYGLLNEKLDFAENKELGAQLMKKAADLGNLQAMKDVKILETMGLLDNLTIEEELSTLDNLKPQAQDILDRSAAGDPQAGNDAAIGLLNGRYGFSKDFDLGLDKLEELVEKGHPKSIEDMKTLVKHGMAKTLDLSTEAQIKLELSSVNMNAVCSSKLRVCEFAENISTERKASIRTMFDFAVNTTKEQTGKMFNLMTFSKTPDLAMVTP